MSSFSRQDVLRILQISSHQLHGWEKAGLIPAQETYSFQDLGQLKTLRSLREEDVPAASIRHSISAMKAVAGMANPLLESTVVRTGTRLAFRHRGAMVDPIRRQLLFDFERAGQKDAISEPAPLLLPRSDTRPNLQDSFLAAVQAEESGDKQRAIQLYEQLLAADPGYAPAYINLGTIYFHLRQFTRAEDLYRRATVADPDYVLAFFDLGNVLDELNRIDESIAAYRRAIALAPRYADAHYNLALAFERKGECRSALRHWHAYLRLDRNGPWAEHARGQIHKLLARETLGIAWRADGYVRPSHSAPNLRLIDDEAAK
ncbi:MAG: tetratricopeptide repeat protein [Acidobacteriota bacterium]